MKQKLNLDRREIYRYLGYHPESHALTAAMETLVENCGAEVLDRGTPRTLCSPLLPLRREEGKLFAGALPLEGRDIALHLEHCTHAVLLAVTLGVELDGWIRRTEATDMARAVVLDAAANVAVEQAAQNEEDALREQLRQQGRYLTGRYSPGYGDFPIGVQRALLEQTDAARRIGLTVTSSCLMVPRKSITAVLGAAPIPVRGHLAGCGACVLREKCEYRKRGTTCGVSNQEN